jgi:hypothetical protein
MLKIITTSRFLHIAIFSLAVAQNGHTNTLTKSQLITESNILELNESDGITGWNIIKKGNSNSDEPNTLELKNNNEIESWDIRENGQANLDGNLWIINLQNGPFPTKEKAKQAGIELIKILRNILTLLPNDISFLQRLKPSENNSSNQTEFSWMISFRLGGHKSRYKAQQIAQKVKLTQKLSTNIFISREPINIVNVGSGKNTQSQITGEFFQTPNINPVKYNTKYFVLISTSGSYLNVRKQPSASSPKIGSLNNRSKVPHIKSETNKLTHDTWFQVEYSKGYFGWVSSKYSEIIIDTRSIISKQKTLKTISVKKNHINKEMETSSLREPKAETTRIQTEPVKNKLKYSEAIAKKEGINQELEALREFYSKKITDSNKKNETLRLENEKKSMLISDLKRTNTILRMKEEFKTKRLLKLKTAISLIQTELDKNKVEPAKLKAEKLASTKELKILSGYDSREIEDHHKRSKTLSSTIDTDIENIIRPNLNNWVKAWQSRNTSLYLSFYSKNFKDRNRSRPKWEAYRRQSLNNSLNILIIIRDIKTQRFNNGLIRVTFIQQFKSDTISDIGIKELVWAKEGSSWKIIKETWKPSVKGKNILSILWEYPVCQICTV